MDSQPPPPPPPPASRYFAVKNRHITPRSLPAAGRWEIPPCYVNRVKRAVERGRPLRPYRERPARANRDLRRLPV